MVHIGNDWDKILEGEFDKVYYQKLRKMLIEEYKTQTIYPPMHDIFNALKLTPYENVNVVILGQDPYHGPNQAHGLCFSVPEGIKPPPSLLNIYKEIEAETGLKMPAYRMSYRMGKTGSTAFKHNSYRPRWTSRIP